jgi:hypothetical protein
MTLGKISLPFPLLCASGFAFGIAGLATGCASDAPAEQKTLHLDESVIPASFYVDDEGNTPNEETDDEAPLFKLTEDDAVPLTRSPSGEQITWGTFRQATGTLDVACTEAGTELELHMTDLIPGGVYTGWIVFFDPPGFAEGGLNTLTGVGPVGPQDGRDSVFVADENGVGELLAVTPAGDVSVSLGDPIDVPECLLDAYEVHVIAAYHTDGKTYGDVPGEPEVVGEHLAWVLRSDL